MTIAVGETIPSTTFKYVPYDAETESMDVCVAPIGYSTENWVGKKVLVVSVPGAFTGTCHQKHIPPYVAKYDEFKAKGIDIVAVVAANDGWVMRAWAKTLGFKDKILPLSDPEAAWSRELGYGQDMTNAGMGRRTGRWYLLLDDLKVVSTEGESAPGVTVSGADHVLSKL
ncbi:Putative peroxiredoxin; AltName: Full=MF1; AltName: Full=Thioredoxin reductase; AltName: Allergen=Mal f 2 [Serendipita indica DSM 11827]|uniref:Related to peroxisomal membrane protein n=1 Tax=Serendipita indica (strain DSM 11827) TaxID=1109443 RepID=G4TCY8_SERID|nr:Putative peroxiredoxin; AltName: Full=MF1; AltName: Full=Thioredoxin reductase; AltName: Allergen=Mal f 2 [Serendipita indica DSM 11827]CCA69181.1 related to peroxisomal membrane protein [Serendipita indica DSM 11827]